MIWSLYRQKGYPRYLTVPELEAEGPLLSALLSGGEGTRCPGCTPPSTGPFGVARSSICAWARTATVSTISL